MSPTSRELSLPRELRDKIYEFTCYPQGAFTPPQANAILGLGRQWGSELCEAFHRESRTVFKADEATIVVSNNYKVSWKMLPDNRTGKLHLHVQLPGAPRSGFGSISSNPQTSWLWRSPVEGKPYIRMTATPNHIARMQFIDWLDQHKESVPEKRKAFFEELYGIVRDLKSSREAIAVSEPLSKELKKMLLEDFPDQVHKWCHGKATHGAW